MRVIGLVSGGKDSCYNMVQCVAAGHQIVALANLKPQDRQVDELDSQMYQTVGTSAIEYIAEAMDLPLYVESITGEGACTNMDYVPTKGDEVEDLYRLLETAAKQTGAQGVSVGAILSDYQRVRVESVCLRLNLTPLAYLWRRNQAELLHEMISCKMESVLIKVACLGLNSSHLGKTLEQMEPTLLKLENKFGVNVCGEGGEYETFALDSPLFKKKLKIAEKTCIEHTSDPIAPVSFLHLDRLELVDKTLTENITQAEMISLDGIQNISPLDYLSDLCPLEETARPDRNIEPESVKLTETNHKVVQNSLGEGWFDIENICGVGDFADSSMRDAADKLTNVLSDLGVSVKSLVKVNMYISSMDEYAVMNREYCKMFGLNPPVRVCVALGSNCLPPGCHVVLHVRGWKGDDARCLHVQGLSHWAPANIGPYSQGFLADNFIHVSGQIGLIPGSMTLHEDPKMELELANRHVRRVLEAMNPGGGHQLDTVICYITNLAHIDLVLASWQSHSHSQTPVKICQVAQLPRAANFEWEVVARLEDES